MKVTLVSPFRTLLNIDTDRAFAEADAFSRTLKNVTMKAGIDDAVSFESHRKPPPERPFTKYTHLDQDYATWFTTPIATAQLNASSVEKMEKFSEKAQSKKLQQTQKPTQARIDIHDNTLAVMTLELEFDPKSLAEHFKNPSDFEIYLSSYAAGCVRYAEDHVIQPFIEVFVETLENDRSWKGAKKLLRKPKEFLAFNDLEHHKFPAWNHEDEPSLWTHRIYHMHSLSAQGRKGVDVVLRDTQFPEDCQYLVKQGTSYVFDERAASVLTNMNATCQYFYCMVDALNHSQKRLTRMVAKRGRSVNLATAYARFDRQENLLSEMENEMLDFTTGLQGMSRDIFDDIQAAFRTPELIVAMENRSSLLRNRLQRAARRKTLVQQKMLTFILVLVGSIQVISLVIQVFGYTENVTEDDRVPGLTDIVQNIPFDLAMTVVALGLVIVALYWAIRHGNIER